MLDCLFFEPELGYSILCKVYQVRISSGFEKFDFPRLCVFKISGFIVASQDLNLSHRIQNNKQNKLGWTQQQTHKNSGCPEFSLSSFLLYLG